MKKLKKLLAIIMVVTLLLSTLPMVSAGAKESYPKLVLDTPKNVSVNEDGVTLSFKPEKDGAYIFYSVGDADTVGMLSDSEDYLIFNDNADGDQNFSIIFKLEANKTYYLDVWVDSQKTVDVQIVVEETVGVDSIEIAQYPFDTNIIEDYEYETFSANGLEVTITFTDGTAAKWVYDEDDYYLDNKVNGHIVSVFLDSDYDDNFFACIECCGVTATIPYTVVESPVDSIEYHCETPIELYENSNGYWMDDNTYYYNYEVPEDAVITINYKDGTSKQVSYYDEVDGVYFNEYDYQETSKAWKVGDDNYFYIEYIDAYVKVPVNLITCPFKNVTLNSAPTREYVYGDYETGYFDYDGEYTLFPFDIRGLSFTVEYNDGTKETYDDDDFDIYDMTIDGYDYSVTEQIISGSGKVETILYYKGAQIKYDVNVVESHIESIEILNGPDKKEYEDNYFADYTGTVVKINYKDGTSAQATADENTLSYLNDFWLTPQIKVGNDIVSVHSNFDIDSFDTYEYFTCAGVGVEYRGITYLESRTVDSLTAKNVTMSGDDIVLNIQYTDGTNEELICDAITHNALSENLVDICARTENGILVYTIGKAKDYSGKFTGYNLYVFEEEYFIPVEIGDVDGDGEVSIMDATEIQMIIAQLKPALKDTDIADVDGDGEVSIMDATAIQMQLAKIN